MKNELVPKEKVLAMKAGRDLNWLVCTIIFDNKTLGSLRPYSTDISFAWQVVDRMEHHEFRISNEYHNGEWYWYCGIEQPEDLSEGYFSATARFLPEAICKAALLAKLEVRVYEQGG